MKNFTVYTNFKCNNTYIYIKNRILNDISVCEDETVIKYILYT